jgi:hypothetical protein
LKLFETKSEYLGAVRKKREILIELEKELYVVFTRIESLNQRTLSLSSGDVAGVESVRNEGLDTLQNSKEKLNEISRRYGPIKNEVSHLVYEKRFHDLSEEEIEEIMDMKKISDGFNYKLNLMNASIAGIRAEMLNNKYPENMQHKEREHVAFCYQKIIWTFEDGGITQEEDWDGDSQ